MVLLGKVIQWKYRQPDGFKYEQCEKVVMILIVRKRGGVVK